MAVDPFRNMIARSLRRLLAPEQEVVRERVTEHKAGEPAQTAPARQLSLAAQAETKLQKVRLTRIRDALGVHWPEHAERICRFAEAAIAKRLLPGDVYEASGDDGFLILFAELSPEDARFKAEALSREIENLLIGSTLSGISVQSAADIADSSGEHSAEVSGGARRSVEWDLVRVREETLSELSFRNGVRFEDVAPTDRISRLSSTALGNSARTLVPPPEGADHMETKPQSGVPFSDQASCYDEVENPEPSLILERRRHPRLIPGIKWFYRPVWDFESSALILFALLPEPSYESILGEGEAASALEMERRAEVDVAAILKAARDLINLSRSNRRLPLVVQVHQGTITNARRQAFILATLKKVPPQFYRQLMLEIVGPAPMECVQCLRDFISGLGAMRIRASLRLEPSRLSGTSITTCGADVLTLRFSDEWSEIAQMAVLHTVAEHAKSVKSDCALWDITTRSMVVAAASSGVRYLSGCAIAKDSPDLSHAVRFSPIDLYVGMQNH